MWLNHVDALKVAFLIYIAVIPWVNPKYVAMIRPLWVKSLWIAATVVVFLFHDVILSIVMLIALVITSIQAEIPFKPQQGEKDVEDSPENVNKDENEKETDAIDAAVTQQDANEAHEALQKYVVEDLLKKASEDGIIKENVDKYPNALESSWNIQGIEKDMVGYFGNRELE